MLIIDVSAVACENYKLIMAVILDLYTELRQRFLEDKDEGQLRLSLRKKRDRKVTG